MATLPLLEGDPEGLPDYVKYTIRKARKQIQELNKGRPQSQNDFNLG